MGIKWLYPIGKCALVQYLLRCYLKNLKFSDSILKLVLFEAQIPTKTPFPKKKNQQKITEKILICDRCRIHIKKQH